MTIYFFDTYENGRHVRDDVGTPCASIAEARRKAMVALPSIAMEQIPEGLGEQTFKMLVRDAEGRSVYLATLRFDGTEVGSTADDADASTLVQLFR
ncbi:MAG: hypothetical protein INR68_11305 [Methylobacterium mesophilicum]|nr:hypothetical protein [Methylobacterium mesophilicum]